MKKATTFIIIVFISLAISLIVGALTATHLSDDIHGACLGTVSLLDDCRNSYQHTNQ